MEKEPVIYHITAMLRQLDEDAIRATYMTVKALFIRSACANDSMGNAKNQQKKAKNADKD